MFWWCRTQDSPALTHHLQGKLLEGDAPDVKEEAESKNGIKKEEQDEKPTKRKVAKKEEEASDEDVKPKKKLAQRKKKTVESDEEASDASTSSPSKKRKRNIKNDPEDVKAEASDAEDTKGDKTKEESDEGDVKDETKDESDEYSDVIDVVPAPKRKKKSKDSAKATSSKPAAKKASLPDDPQEAEIKKLQSQLTKCGVRKLWHNELKQYGDDSRAKIRHLKKMLSDVGMDGRFSEAKAKEIKETRELLAEAEAAQEMNALWGMESGGRSSRHKSRGVKVVESDGSGDEGGDEAKGEDHDDEEEEVTFAARRRRAQADLAFLGDDSDSD